MNPAVWKGKPMPENSAAYSGICLRINLSTGKITKEDRSEDFSMWMGGSGLAAKILYDELCDWVTPYDPMNKVIFASGALVGTVAPGACKMSVSTLSPVTGGWATGSSDSHIGLELKYAGYDCLILEGRAYAPCYIYIEDDLVELRDASHLWGLTTWETLDTLRGELDDSELHVISIGPAGENLSRSACVMQDRNRAFGRCGTGAVLGSKNFKALVVKGSGRVKVAQPERFLAHTLVCRKRITSSKTAKALGEYGTVNCYLKKQEMCGIPFKNGQACCLPDDYVEDVSPLRVIEKYQIARQGFPGCALCCGRVISITDGKYKGFTANMNQWEVVGSIMGKTAVRDGRFMVVANALCNQLGLDVDVAGGAIAWAMECYQRGIITATDTGGLELEWGNEETILELISQMSYRKGFGNVLAEGSARASELIGRGSEYYAMHVKKQDLYELMRSSNGWCLGTSVSTRGGGHTTGAPTCDANGMPVDDEASKRILGIPGDVAGDPKEYRYKAQLVYYFEVLHRMCNCTGICIFNSAGYDIGFVNTEDIAELMSAATGREYTVKDLEEIAMRQLNLEKAFNLRFTGFARKDDYPPERELCEPIPYGKRKGWKIDREKYDEMLDDYYAMHGWDKASSYPTRKTLEKYHLGNVADDLERLGKMGKE